MKGDSGRFDDAGFTDMGLGFPAERMASRAEIVVKVAA